MALTSSTVSPQGNYKVLLLAMGAACANALSCTATILILVKTADIYKTGGLKTDAAAYKDLLSGGMPDASNPFIRIETSADDQPVTSEPFAESPESSIWRFTSSVNKPPFAKSSS